MMTGEMISTRDSVREAYSMDILGDNDPTLRSIHLNIEYRKWLKRANKRLTEAVRFGVDKETHRTK